MGENNTQILACNDVVLGYVLRKRIGSGGYGEVWSAEAPGGVPKAVKFIYGFHDENRAQRELRALDRIKHIRHPFLLSLERIDIVDGRMVVITELADHCLKARFNQCLGDGLEGIPRDELLQYMREAAEALDFIAEIHSLAHLDIKPENLLVVGQHIKVADFGLVKDLQSVNQSLMDGLTPAYAAPELFDGRPHRASDQYSLAITYQELLTGARPFSGTTAAQLANQHLSSRPNLNALPRGDQAVIAKALQKDPERRYKDCRLFAQELTRRRSRTRINDAASRNPGLDLANTSDATSPVPTPDGSITDRTISVADSMLAVYACEGDVEKLEPLTIDESTAAVRPTLFFGVGSTGVQIVRQLKRRISERYGDASSLPAFAYLYLDVDRKALFELSKGPDGGLTENSELLDTPLRRPEDYRGDKSIDLNWIGRRWIYNIPKSQLTESLRPLGRLALVDHHEKIFQRISDKLTQIAREESLAATADRMQLTPSQQPPQVFLVGSVSGGTASGMINDLAFLTRIAMSEQGLSEGSIDALLTHGTSRGANEAALAVANTAAFIKEMNHYDLNGYPGCTALGLPEFDTETPVFDRVTLIHLGEEVTAYDRDYCINDLSRFLYLATATRCSAIFEAIRDPELDDSSSFCTFGFPSLDGVAESISRSPALELVHRVFEKWSETEHNPIAAENVRQVAEQVLEINHLDARGLEATIRTILGDGLKGEADKRSLEVVMHNCATLLESPRITTNPLTTVHRVLDMLYGDAPLEPGQSAPPRSEKNSVMDYANIRIPELLRRNRDRIPASVFRLIDEPEFRISGATRVCEAMIEDVEDRVRELTRSITQLRSQLADNQARAQEVLAAKGPQNKEDLLAIIEETVQTRLVILVNSLMQRVLRLASRDLDSVNQQLAEFAKQWNADDLPTPAPVSEQEATEDGELSAEPIETILEREIRKQARQLLGEFEKNCESQILAPGEGLLKFLTENRHLLRELPRHFLQLANEQVNRLLQELRIDRVLGQARVPSHQVTDLVDDLATRAWPFLASCGGRARLIVATPQRAPLSGLTELIAKKIEIQANVIPATCGEFAVCCYLEQVPIDHVLNRLLQTQPEARELVERLHSRNNVNWSNVSQLL